jgi:hypothetical protein
MLRRQRTPPDAVRQIEDDGSAKSDDAQISKNL